MENVVEVEDVWKVFEIKDLLNRKRVEVLRGINLRVKRGEVLGFLGPNGAGKTTTLRLLMGFIRPTRGSVKVFGKSPGELSAKGRIGYLPESPHPPGHLKGREFLKAMAIYSGFDPRHVKSRVEELMEKLGLVDASNRLVAAYSKGMIQRLALATALVGDPDLVILDEPNSGLDPEGRSFVLNLVRELKTQGKTVIFSTHILSDVKGLVDRIALIVKGRIVRVVRSDWFLRDYVLVRYERLKRAESSIMDGRVLHLAKSNGISETLVEIPFLNEFRRELEQRGCKILEITSRLPELEEILTSEIMGYGKV